jgi:hypothetical protein
MDRDHNDIYSIVDRLRVLEEGLDKNQRSVNQLSATFKPKTVAVLTAKKDPKNPMAGKLVGSDESAEPKEAVLEADVAEDVLEKVKSSFKDFIKQAEEQIKDTDIKEKKREDTDLKSREKQDRDLIVKVAPVATDPTQMAPVKTMTTECGIYEMHGNERDGFEIRRGGRCLPTRFKDLAEAEMAIEMFLARQRQRDESQDYLDEE